MGLPIYKVDESSRAVREAAIKDRLGKIAKQQNVILDNVTVEKLVAEVQTWKTKLDERRRNRQSLAKFGNTLQAFTNTWSQFLKVYAGVCEIAKGIDNQYGAIASGALMVLLQIGENKEGRENAITSIFEDLTESWLGDAGRLSLYSNAYPDSARLKDFIADVDLGVAELAIESIEYYARPPYVRFWQAIRHPPKLGIDIKANEIKKAIHEVDSESIALLIQDHAREREVRRRERDQEGKDQRSHIAALLGSSMKLSDIGTMVDQCKILHASAFTNIGLLRDFKLYEPPPRTKNSSVLILSGLNFDGYDTGKRLCWLSPVATEIAEEYRRNRIPAGSCRLLFHSACYDEESRFSKKKEAIDVCLSRFIVQLLLSDDDFFTKHRQSLEDDIRNSSRRRSETMQFLLEKCPSTDEVCIIVDRLDRIAPVPDDESDESDEDDVSDVLESILNIVSTAPCKIRLVVTIDASQWSKVRTDSEFESKWKIWERNHTLDNFSPLFKINWRQPEHWC
ncbi:MAG: hypothetical protein Q9204_005127, partial [Flavoplaca sp. TL-2023a]